ncbi:MAG: hypothetical protein ACLRQ0_10325 [Monoglobales bacterium]
MLKYLKCLPGELNRQQPSDIWRLLDTITGDRKEPEIPEGMEWFYGM